MLKSRNWTTTATALFFLITTFALSSCGKNDESGSASGGSGTSFFPNIGM